VPVTDGYVDKGYRGHDYTGDATIHIAGSGSKRLTRTQRRRRRRRSAVEPKIGHAKHEHRMGRCYLKGLEGDAMNVVLAAAGANLAKLLRLLPCALRRWLLQTRPTPPRPRMAWVALGVRLADHPRSSAWPRVAV